MARPKGTGFNPDIFDQQFLKVLLDLQQRNIDLAKNEHRLEKLLDLTKGNLWKLKKGVTGLGKPRRDNIVKQMQLLFDVNPMAFGDIKQKMYNGDGPKVAELPSLDYSDIARSPSIMTAGDHMELQTLRIQVELLKDQIKSKDQQIKSQQGQISSLEKLVAVYEKTANFPAK